MSIVRTPCPPFPKPFPCNHTIFLPQKATTFSPTCSIHSIQSRGVHVEQLTPPVSFGEIHVIVGPMFDRKTTTLLCRIESESSNGRSVAIVKSNKDTRYGLDSIVTHDGAKLPCLALPDLSSFRQKFGLEAYDQLDVIGIDEAQFFEDLYDFCREAADHDGKRVIVAGLDGNYLRRSFGSVLDIIPLADSVTKLTARCELCGKCAFFTLRKTEETQTELIGAADVYMPVSAALCQRTSRQGRCKDCPRISKRSVCLLCIVQLRKTMETQTELIGLSTCLCVSSTMSADK